MQRSFLLLVGLSLLTFTIGVNGSLRRVRSVARENMEFQARVHHSTFNWLYGIGYNYDFANTVENAAKAQCTRNFPSKFLDTLAARVSRFEAAIGLAVQRNPAMIDALKEMIHRELCTAAVAFEGQVFTALEKAKQDKIIANLYALPSAHLSVDGLSSEEKAWLGLSFGKLWMDLDNSRSGMWVGPNLDENLAAFRSILESNHYRELLHTLTRASLYGEDLFKPSEFPRKAPGSLRHAIYVLLNTPDRLSLAQSKCGFTVQEHKKIPDENSNKDKKTYFGGSKDAVIPLARKDGDATFRGKAHETGKGGCKQFPTTVSPAALQALGMPPITKREISYFKNYFRMYDKSKEGMETNAFNLVNGGSGSVPWGYGACVWDMEYYKAKSGDKVKITQNADWKKSMEGDGLQIDAGPSGTTDEILSVADWMGMTKKVYSFCALRDVAFANMIIPEHHTLGEIIQGSYDKVRNPGGTFEDFHFGNPFQSIHWCDKAENDFEALFMPNHKLSDSINRFGVANRLFREKNNRNVLNAWQVLKSQTDYARGMVPHVIDDPSVRDGQAFETCFCSIDEKTTAISYFQVKKGTECALKSIQMSVGCQTKGMNDMDNGWDAQCFGNPAPRLGEFFPTTQWQVGGI